MGWTPTCVYGHPRKEGLAGSAEGWRARGLPGEGYTQGAAIALPEILDPGRARAAAVPLAPWPLPVKGGLAQPFGVA